ncbi:helix-turn-helix domain-containing protein [Actinomadura keratinilytica]
MAPRTQSWKDLPPECPDEKRLLATCLRRVKDCTDLTQQRLAAKCGIVTSTLNGYLNARNQPTPETLRRFYLAVKEDTDQRGLQLPHSLHELESILSGQTEKARTASQRPLSGSRTGAMVRSSPDGAGHGRTTVRGCRSPSAGGPAPAHGHGARLDGTGDASGPPSAAPDSGRVLHDLAVRDEPPGLRDPPRSRVVPCSGTLRCR